MKLSWRSPLLEALEGHRPYPFESLKQPPYCLEHRILSNLAKVITMSNRLLNETSPYLLQHAHNPVDWYPWGEEALKKAREEDRPILLSIGYSACHWCHVMERESFENQAIADIMNKNFVNIKVDREERPDLDTIYMEAVQALAGHGGWPMTVFLLPDGTPFFGGTYFPPQDRTGMPGFPRVLLGVAEAYRTRKSDILKSGEQIRGFLRQRSSLKAEGKLDQKLIDDAFGNLFVQFDRMRGGFGSAPKFPQPMLLEFLLRVYQARGKKEALNMVELTLDRMARGGVYDHLGGGFHRYSVDEAWQVPHFEKMLYDNAQLSPVYLHAYQITGNPFFRQVVEETLDYVLREMTDHRGGFYSTQDADSEGEEGKFFLWTQDELLDALEEEDALIFSLSYDVSREGNFEGKNILHFTPHLDMVAMQVAKPIEHVEAALERARKTLFEYREKRIKPGRDDKVLTGWNGLMLRAFAEAGASLDRPDYTEAAVKNATFLISTMWDGSKLLRSYRDGQARIDGYLEDYAFLADGLLALYEATFDRTWLDVARNLSNRMVEWFWDDETPGFYDTGTNHEVLVARPKGTLDNAIPSGNSLAADVLYRLSIFFDNDDFRQRAEAMHTTLSNMMREQPMALGRLLCSLDTYLATVKEIALVGEPSSTETMALLSTIRQRYIPNKVVALRRPKDEETEDTLPLLAGKTPVDGTATAYVCQNYTCQSPVTEPNALVAQL